MYLMQNNITEYVAQILFAANKLLSTDDWQICSEDTFYEVANIIAINISRAMEYNAESINADNDMHGIDNIADVKKIIYNIVNNKILYLQD